ncbi:VWA domain-containing protein [Marinicauda algicola]|nr:von Willebrand factor type A domain-containing protein [Marinicauda algicola]
MVTTSKTYWLCAASMGVLLVMTACARTVQDEGDGRADLAREREAAEPVPHAPTPPPPPSALEAYSLVATGARMAAEPMIMPQPMPGDIDRERYEDVDANPVVVTQEEPVSTFSIDVDTASYAVARRYLRDGVLPPRDAIRPEEIINYVGALKSLGFSDRLPFGD